MRAGAFDGGGRLPRAVRVRGVADVAMHVAFQLRLLSPRRGRAALRLLHARHAGRDAGRAALRQLVFHVSVLRGDVAFELSVGRAGADARRPARRADLSVCRRDRRTRDADGVVPASAGAGDALLRRVVRRVRGAWRGRALAARLPAARRLRREGGRVPAAYLAAQGAPGRARARERAALGTADQGGRVRRHRAHMQTATRSRKLGRADLLAGGRHDGAGRGARAAFRQPQAYAGLLVAKPDRLHPRGRGAVRASGARRTRCPRGARSSICSTTRCSSCCCFSARASSR